MYREHHRESFYPFFRRRRPWRRKFLTKEEKKEMKERHKEKKIKWMESYKEFLEKELAGVNERLEEMKKEKE